MSTNRDQWVGRYPEEALSAAYAERGHGEVRTTVETTGMHPRLWPGDRITLAAVRPLKINDTVLLRRRDGLAILARFIRIADGAYVVESLDPRERRTVPLDDVVGPVRRVVLSAFCGDRSDAPQYSGWAGELDDRARAAMQERMAAHGSTP